MCTWLLRGHHHSPEFPSTTWVTTAPDFCWFLIFLTLYHQIPKDLEFSFFPSLLTIIPLVLPSSLTVINSSYKLTISRFSAVSPGLQIHMSSCLLRCSTGIWNITFPKSDCCWSSPTNLLHPQYSPSHSVSTKSFLLLRPRPRTHDPFYF